MTAPLATFTALPVEILDEIISQTSALTQASLCRVSTSLYPLAIRHLYRRRDLTSTEMVESFSRLCLAKSVVALAVVHVHVRHSYEDVDCIPRFNDLSFSSLVAQAFTKLRRLKILDLDVDDLYFPVLSVCNFPVLQAFQSATLPFHPIIVAFIQRHPNLRFFLMNEGPSMADTFWPTFTLPKLLSFYGRPDVIPLFFPYCQNVDVIAINWGWYDKPIAPVFDALAALNRCPRAIYSLRTGWAQTIQLVEAFSTQLPDVRNLFIRVNLSAGDILGISTAPPLGSIVPYLARFTNLTQLSFSVVDNFDKEIELSDLDNDWDFLQTLGSECPTLIMCCLTTWLEWTRVRPGSPIWLLNKRTEVSQQWLDGKFYDRKYAQALFNNLMDHPLLQPWETYDFLWSLSRHLDHLHERERLAEEDSGEDAESEEGENGESVEGDEVNDTGYEGEDEGEES